MLSVSGTSLRVNYGNSMVEINSTNFIRSLELPFLCVCRIFSINALNQYNPSLESWVGKNMFTLSLNSLSKQIVQNQPRSSPSWWWPNAGAPSVGARVVRRLPCAIPLSEEHPDRRDSHGVLSIININISITTKCHQYQLHEHHHRLHHDHDHAHCAQVTQFHFLSWADGTIPTSTRAILEFRR